ncbi:zinc ion binding protein [Actinidia rufa]|uniref:Zinc ion binding protein n=1 Tax=Actinidia rufa TaxID=165716 RepID=A0A7J0EVG0_9ERIC|nr:zinc ion binding protein [Actinidia rufa]
MEMVAEQPKSAFRGAEAVLNLPPTSSVSIAYHSLFGPHDDLILLELYEKLLPYVLHHRVTLRGQPDEDAVLCTMSKTYTVKFVGTSNSVLLIPPSDQLVLGGNTQDCDEKDRVKKLVAPVIKVAPGVMELVEVAPRIDRLKMLLSENPYRSDDALMSEELDEMGKNNTRFYSWSDLIDRNYMDGILNMLLHNLVLNDWSLNGLNEIEVVGVLQSDGFPCEIAQHCLQVYGSKTDDGVWKLDEKQIPEGMQASYDMLEGEVLTEKIGIETWVYAFDVSSLPSAPEERFSMLFRERPKWEWKDLQPYIRDLSAPGLSSEGLLLKYTRRTQPTPDAEPVFSAR